MMRAGILLILGRDSNAKSARNRCVINRRCLWRFCVVTLLFKIFWFYRGYTTELDAFRFLSKGIFNIGTCRHIIDYSYSQITFKLHGSVVDDNRWSRMDFMSCVQMSPFALSHWNPAGTTNTTVLIINLHVVEEETMNPIPFRSKDITNFDTVCKTL